MDRPRWCCAPQFDPRALTDGFRWDRLGWDERFRCFVYGGFLHARPEAVVVGISAQFQGLRGEGGVVEGVAP